MEASEAAQLARERLHAEIERVRQGVEEMLDEQESRGANPHGPSSEALRRELDELRLETRGYVKRRVRKSEKKLNRSIRALEARSAELEQRIDQVEQDRNAAEWRIHDNTAAMLDGLLEDVRAIADRLAA
jgi:chromosome segregation ATPase